VALGAWWDEAPGAVKLLTPVYCGLIAMVAKEALAELKASFSALWSATWPILAATIAMTTVVLLLRGTAFAGRTEFPLIELILLSATGVVVYLGALFAVGRTVISEIAEVVGWILRRHGDD
jgi:hypothetical protein